MLVIFLPKEFCSIQKGLKKHAFNVEVSKTFKLLNSYLFDRCPQKTKIRVVQPVRAGDDELR